MTGRLELKVLLRCSDFILMCIGDKRYSVSCLQLLSALSSPLSREISSSGSVVGLQSISPSEWRLRLSSEHGIGSREAATGVNLRVVQTVDSISDGSLVIGYFAVNDVGGQPAFLFSDGSTTAFR
jgi:hypothetical protein